MSGESIKTDDGALDPRFIAVVDMLRRTGATSFQIRYSDDEEPVVWFVVVTYPDDRWEVDAGSGPFSAMVRVAERLMDGGQCRHCHKPTGFDVNFGEMPLPELVCWYLYDPELKKIRRGCEGDER